MPVPRTRCSPAAAVRINGDTSMPVVVAHPSMFIHGRRHLVLNQIFPCKPWRWIPIRHAGHQLLTFCAVRQTKSGGGGHVYTFIICDRLRVGRPSRFIARRPRTAGMYCGRLESPRLSLSRQSPILCYCNSMRLPMTDRACRIRHSASRSAPLPAPCMS